MLLTRLSNFWVLTVLNWLCEEYSFGESFIYYKSFDWIVFWFSYDIYFDCKVNTNELFFTRRYFKYELLAKGAITKENLPIFLSAWLDRSNATCMFSANQQRTWSTSHLTGGGWYLDCAPSFTPSFETELRKSREAVGESGVEMIDLQGIEDEHERAKALARRLEEDRKKALRVKEAEERAAQKEMEKLQRSLEKTNMRGRKKMHSHSEPEGKSLLSPSPTNDSGSQARGTKRDSSYDQLSPVFNLGEENESEIDELILNVSMNEVLGGSSDDYTSYYKGLKNVMIKVFFLCLFMPTFTIFIFILNNVTTIILYSKPYS